MSFFQFERWNTLRLLHLIVLFFSYIRFVCVYGDFTRKLKRLLWSRPSFEEIYQNDDFTSTLMTNGLWKT